MLWHVIVFPYTELHVYNGLFGVLKPHIHRLRLSYIWCLNLFMTTLDLNYHTRKVWPCSAASWTSISSDCRQPNLHAVLDLANLLTRSASDLGVLKMPLARRTLPRILVWGFFSDLCVAGSLVGLDGFDSVARDWAHRFSRQHASSLEGSDFACRMTYSPFLVSLQRRMCQPCPSAARPSDGCCHTCPERQSTSFSPSVCSLHVLLFYLLLHLVHAAWNDSFSGTWCSRHVWDFSNQVFGARGLVGKSLLMYLVLAACLENFLSSIWCSRPVSNFFGHLFGARGLWKSLSGIWCSRPGKFSFHVFGARGLENYCFRYLVLAACLEKSLVYGARGLVGKSLFMYLVLAAWWIPLSCIRSWCSRFRKFSLQVFGARGLFGRFVFRYLVLAACMVNFFSSIWCSRPVWNFSFHVVGARGRGKSLFRYVVLAAWKTIFSGFCCSRLVLELRFSGIWCSRPVWNKPFLFMYLVLAACLELFFSFHVCGARGCLQVFGARGCLQVFVEHGLGNSLFRYLALAAWGILFSCIWCSRPVWKICFQVFGARGLEKSLSRYLLLAGCLKNHSSRIWCARPFLENFFSSIWCSRLVWRLSFHVFGARGCLQVFVARGCFQAIGTWCSRLGKLPLFMYMVLAVWSENLFSGIWCLRLVWKLLFKYLVLAACLELLLSCIGYSVLAAWENHLSCIWCSLLVWKFTFQVFGAGGLFGDHLSMYLVLAVVFQHLVLTAVFK